MTKIVNLYGGPGTGKSTTAALTFGYLKEEGVNAEIVTEFAKDVVWEDRRVIACQPYLFGKQLWRLERLMGKVDVVVTDAPLLMSIVYAEGLGSHWMHVVMDQYAAFDNIDIFLDRDNVAHPYNPEGRYQKSVEEAQELDEKIATMLMGTTKHLKMLPPHIVPVKGAAEEITDLVLDSLTPSLA